MGLVIWGQTKRKGGVKTISRPSDCYVKEKENMHQEIPRDSAQFQYISLFCPIQHSNT